jgi:hypothetical protein
MKLFRKEGEPDFLDEMMAKADAYAACAFAAGLFIGLAGGWLLFGLAPL